MTQYNYGPGIQPPTQGTSGQVLTSNGAGQPPTYQAAAAGGGQLELIEHIAVSGAFQFSTISGYKYYYLVLSLTSGSASVNMTLNADSGNNYNFIRQSSAAAAAVAAAAAFELFEGRTDGTQIGALNIDGQTRGTAHEIGIGCSLCSQNARWKMLNGEWTKGSAGTLTQINITGTTLSGFATLYGIKET